MKVGKGIILFFVFYETPLKYKTETLPEVRFSKELSIAFKILRRSAQTPKIEEIKVQNILICLKSQLSFIYEQKKVHLINDGKGIVVESRN